MGHFPLLILGKSVSSIVTARAEACNVQNIMQTVHNTHGSTSASSSAECDIFLQQLWRYNTHAVEMRISYLNSTTGAGTEAQTVMVNDIPEVDKVCVLNTCAPTLIYTLSIVPDFKPFHVPTQRHVINAIPQLESLSEKLSA